VTGIETFVNFDVGASPEEVEHVQGAFADAGVAAEVSDQPYSLVASGRVEAVDAFVVVATTATSGFLGAFAAKAGSDAYELFKRLIARLRTARSADGGRLEIIIRGESEGPDIFIGPNTPDSALGQLLTSPLPPAPSGMLEYDGASGRWRDADAS